MPTWLIAAIVSAAIGALGAWITFRIRFERFEARDQEREKYWAEWRRGMEEFRRKVEDRPVNGHSGLTLRVEKIEAEIGTHTTGMRGAIHALEGNVRTIQEILSPTDRGRRDG
jgi:hypothetical protein